MNRIYRDCDGLFLNWRPIMALALLLIGCSAAAVADSDSQAASVTLPFSVHATHLLGFEGLKSNASGILAVEEGCLRLYSGGLVAAEVKIASVQDVSLGEENKQIGGLPMTLGKAATPYGGGRVISLFAHKKYDTMVLEYVDSDGALHGAIFQLQKGQGELLRNELVAKGAHAGGNNGQSTAEVRNENK